ncbi:hypothetical protein [Acidianus ambivalens]|uniref:Uncharacterized protein n=1 Tax=Acidianus ambivalens TaxID=2283 RepID=A0A650CU30_ACIAM|nr:hypothetical protein [Acidianus ambivalens]MQL56149.1 hypothetical protein [Acidianus ambivalens]QGR21308.1 hypothetical protein D1866_04340 [Acidianus ambivalens]
MKAQSEYIGFIIAIILIVIVIIPLFFLLNNYDVPSVKTYNYCTVIEDKINGNGIIIYFNASPSKPELVIYRGCSSYYLSGVYYENNGIWYNITSCISYNGKKLPLPLIYNLTLPTQVWKYPLSLQIEAYNDTVFAIVYPNQTAFTS